MSETIEDAKKEKNSEKQSKAIRKEETLGLQMSGEKLKENELEDVSGGLWGITLIDTCKNEYQSGICRYNDFGRCPRLIIEEQEHIRTYNFSGYCYVVTCSKGCFTKLKTYE